MKKVLSFALVVAMVFALCIPAMAVVSPTASKVVTVVVIGGNGTPVGKYATTVLKEGDGKNFKITVDPNSGTTFDSWKFYKLVSDANGAKTTVEAVADQDYKIVSKDDKTNSMEIEALVDLILCGNYDGKVTDPSIGVKAFEVSPKTGDNFALIAIIAIVALAGVAFTSKKVFVK